jgi:mannose-1-phosphate guanylyltransferase/mannose-6-phosphate isomerase
MRKDKMNHGMLVPVILAGGSGTRLWPLSRELYPKQFLALTGKNTMLQETITRVLDMDGAGKPLVICQDKHRFLAADQLREIACDATLLLEPVGKNTAPAVAVAALKAMSDGDDPILLVLPADHVIQDVQQFKDSVALGLEMAQSGHLVTFGIVPHQPETGYGYIARGEKIATQNADDTAFRVGCFVEKPDLTTAESYVASGQYYWNSGMFMFQASAYLEELERFVPDMVSCARQAVDKARSDHDFLWLDEEAFSACPSDSIDYAVMEKTARSVVIPIDCGWSDVGSWSALLELGERDGAGNILQGNVLAQDVKNCYVNASHRMVAAVGVQDHIIVETADAVLVISKDKAQDVKKIVEMLKETGQSEASLHRRVFRPWGSYEGIDNSDRFQVKRIVVKPGATLSLQMHYHRAEHWIVVKGTARVTNGTQSILLSENQSTYIPLGEQHRLENPGVIPLEIIEVQSGSYLGEDDIVRFEDNYGRVKE